MHMHTSDALDRLYHENRSFLEYVCMYACMCLCTQYSYTCKKATCMETYTRKKQH